MHWKKPTKLIFHFLYAGTTHECYMLWLYTFLNFVQKVEWNHWFRALNFISFIQICDDCKYLLENCCILLVCMCIGPTVVLLGTFEQQIFFGSLIWTTGDQSNYYHMSVSLVHHHQWKSVGTLKAIATSWDDSIAECFHQLGCPIT